MAHEVLKITNRNGESIYGNKWLNKKSTNKCVVIVHGMSEYSFRYNEFAEFLNKAGYDVYALDHLGHGLNCPDKVGLGIWPKDGFSECINNFVDLITSLQKDGNEVYVFAHSMGSFMGQAFMERYPGLVKKIVLCGSSGPQGVHKMGKIVATLHLIGKDPNKPCKFMNGLAFSSYNSKIKNPKSPNSWLSWNEENVKKYDADEYCGFIQSRGFFKSFMGDGIASAHKKSNMEKIDRNQKVLLIVGQDDPVGNYSKAVSKLHSIYKKMGIDSSLIIYPHMRHEILNEDKKLDVMNDVLKFLEK